MDGKERQLSKKVDRNGQWIWTGVIKKEKTKNLLGCFEINSMFWTSVHGFFPDLSRAYNMVRIIEGKIVQKWAHFITNSKYNFSESFTRSSSQD